MGLLRRETVKRILSLLSDKCQFDVAKKGEWGTKGFRVKASAHRTCIKDYFDKIREKLKEDPDFAKKLNENVEAALKELGILS